MTETLNKPEHSEHFSDVHHENGEALMCMSSGGECRVLVEVMPGYSQEEEQQLIASTTSALEAIDRFTGSRAADIFTGLHIKIGEDIAEGGAKAVAEENQVLLNGRKMLLSVAEMKQVSGTYSDGELAGFPDEHRPGGALEYTLVHEIGHVLDGQTKTGEAYHRVSADESPTSYGREADEWHSDNKDHEAFAEGFAHAVYGMPISETMEATVRETINARAQEIAENQANAVEATGAEKLATPHSYEEPRGNIDSDSDPNRLNELRDKKKADELSPEEEGELRGLTVYPDRPRAAELLRKEYLRSLNLGEFTDEEREELRVIRANDFKSGGVSDLIRNGESHQEHIDTSVRPIDPEVDLGGVHPTTLEKKAEVMPSAVIDVDTNQLAQRELRNLLMEKYPEADFPDIYKILDDGLILTRFFNEERLAQAQMSGTDRDSSSQLAYQGEHGEKEVVRANGLNRDNVTYLASQRLSNRSMDGGEPMIKPGRLYGNVLLVYDPRYVQKLGSTSSGLSYFPDGAKAALLAIVRFPKQV